MKKEILDIFLLCSKKEYPKAKQSYGRIILSEHTFFIIETAKERTVVILSGRTEAKILVVLKSIKEELVERINSSPEQQKRTFLSSIYAQIIEIENDVKEIF